MGLLRLAGKAVLRDAGKILTGTRHQRVLAKHRLGFAANIAFGVLMGVAALFPQGDASDSGKKRTKQQKKISLKDQVEIIANEYLEQGCEREVAYLFAIQSLYYAYNIPTKTIAKELGAPHSAILEFIHAPGPYVDDEVDDDELVEDETDDDFDEEELVEDEADDGFDENELDDDSDEDDIEDDSFAYSIKSSRQTSTTKEDENSMQLINLQCHNCGAQLEINLDHLKAFCPYCGQKLMIDFDQLGQVLAEKEKTTRHVNTEQQKTQRLQMEYDYKEREDKRNNKVFGKIMIGGVAIMVAMYIWLTIDGNKSKKETQAFIAQLESIEAVVETNIKQGDYDSALINANKLHYTKGGNDEQKAWDQKREAYIEMIQTKIREQDLNDPNNIFVAMSSEDVKGKDYQEVIEQFKSLGFTNVTSQASPQKPGIFDKNGSVEHVLVGGKSSFTVEDYFAKDTPIIIYYYSK